MTFRKMQTISIFSAWLSHDNMQFYRKQQQETMWIQNAPQQQQQQQ